MTGIPRLASFAIPPWVKFAAPVLLVLALVIGFRWWLADVKHDAATEAVHQERQEQATEIVNRMEKADDTRQKIADPRSRARYDECLLSARNPENCKRFLPE